MLPSLLLDLFCPEKMHSFTTGIPVFSFLISTFSVSYDRDPRQPSTPIRSHTSTHSDDITSLSFFPQNSARNILLSASTDGLLCTSFADEDDEDEAIIQVANWGSSISQAGWIRPSYPQSIDTPQPAIWAASDMETFSTWTSEVGQQQIYQLSCLLKSISWIDL